MLVQRGAVEHSTDASKRALARPGPQTRAPASGYTGATCPLERDAEARTTPQLKWAVREGIDMNAPSVEVSSQDISQTRADHGRAENLVQETITRFGIWTPRWQLASLQRTLLFTGFAWLIIAVIVLRFTLASVTTDVLAFLAAAVVGFFAHDATGRTEQRARAAAAGATGPTAEADRMRVALLAAVSHDLRSPLAAAAAAVSCLRSPDLKLTPADQDELLATAEESLDLLSRLAATLLDVTRLQAGAPWVFPPGRPGRDHRVLAGWSPAVGPECAGRPPARAAQGGGRPAGHGTGHREPDRQCAAVLAGRITAAADRQRPQRPDRAARDRLRAGRP